MAEWTAKDHERAQAWRDQPEWERRGRLLDALDRARADVSRREDWKGLAREAGSERGAPSGFFRGNPPVVSYDGEDVVIRERGLDAARDFRKKYPAA